MAQTSLARQMEARSEVEADVRAPAQAIVDRIHAAMADGLYPDGLTPPLQRALAVNQMLAIEPAQDQAPAPTVLPDLIEPAEA